MFARSYSLCCTSTIHGPILIYKTLLVSSNIVKMVWKVWWGLLWCVTRGGFMNVRVPNLLTYIFTSSSSSLLVKRGESNWEIPVTYFTTEPRCDPKLTMLTSVILWRLWEIEWGGEIKPVQWLVHYWNFSWFSISSQEIQWLRSTRELQPPRKKCWEGNHNVFFVASR